MKYYIIGTAQDGKKRVIYTASNIAYARKRVHDLIEMDMHVLRYTNGYNIVTARLEKEYHSVSIYTDEPHNSRFMAGVKIKADNAAAVRAYENGDQ